MTAPAPVDARQLARATGIAALVAVAVLVVAVLPAEYGIDPTGAGRALGFAQLAEAPAPPIVEAVNDSAPLYELQATWRLVSLPIAQLEGRLTQADPEERLRVPIRVANLTSLTATLTWNDTDLVDGELTEGDTLEVGLRGPDDARSPLAQGRNERGMEGNATTTLALRRVPFPEENATSGTLTIPTGADTAGVGNYTVVVRLLTARGVDGSEVVDPGQSWTLVLTAEAYELDVRRRADLAGDRVRITLEPGRAFEYKFAMATGARMEYRWSATSPVHSDLHGDLADAPDEFVSAKVATLAEDAGVYVAPFDGRHGWFWHNRGSSPLTITLETSGDYEILGAV